MSLAEAAYLVATGFFAIYGLLVALECGVVLRQALSGNNTSGKLFTPVWEVTNVFLVFGFTTVAMLFSDSLSLLSDSLMPILLIGLAAILTRACLVLSLFYIKPKTRLGTYAWLLVFLNFLIPAVFIAAGAYLLSGQLFWQTVYGVSLFISGLVGVETIGLLYADRHSQTKKRSGYSLAVIWLLLLGCGLPLALVHDGYFFPKWLAISLLATTVIGLLLAYNDSRSGKNLLWIYSPLAGLAAVFLLAISNWPYLVYGQLKLEDAFTGQAYAGFFLIASLALLPLLILGGWLFVKLYKTTASAD